MNIKSFNESDYPIICSWWKDHNWPCIPLTFLPKIGIIVDNCAVGFLYTTDSKICWLEFVVVDPKSDKIKRRKALDALVSEAEKIAKSLKFEVIFTSASHKGLIERYKTHGFKTTDENMTNLIRTL